MRAIFGYILALAIFSTILTTATGCDDSIEFANAPPGGLSISRNVCYLGPEDSVVLTGTATDGDGDEISFKWTAEAGTLSPADGVGQVVTWQAPEGAGTYRVTLTVTDQIDDSRKNIDLDVGRNLEILHDGGVLDQTDYPYIVPNITLLRLPEIITVTIEAGVTIVFNNSNGGLQVEGTLNINGTEEDRVMMIPNSAPSQSGDCPGTTGTWNSVKFLGDMAGGTWSYVTLNSSSHGIDMEDGAVLIADNLIVDQAKHNGVSLNTGSSLTLTNSRIWENGAGIYSGNSILNVQNCSIRYNSNYGMNIVTSGGPTDVTIRDSDIANNGVYGFLLGLDARPVVNNCSFYFNGQLAPSTTVYFSPAYSNTSDIDMTGNWWGGAETPHDISAQIVKNGASVNVDYSGWLTEEP